MTDLLSRMLPFGATNPDNEDDIEYSIATEYHGPPVTYELPRAVPIDVKRIPTAAIVSPASLSDNLSLPVVQPILAPDLLNKNFSKELTSGQETTVSPTSVITFEQSATGSHNCVLSGELSSSGRLGFLNGRDCSPEQSGGVGSSGTLGFSNSLEESPELSGSSGTLRFSNDRRDSADLLNARTPPDWRTTESGLSPLCLSSDISSCKAEDCNDEHPLHVKRNQIVTFRDADLIESVHEEFDCDEPEANRGSKQPETKVRKGSCYRCFKGNRFTEKEACIVCNAKYCSNCVLTAMGSMPEGRKCVTCIGSPIDESNRVCIGNCSRMLKRLLSDLEVQQIMKAEQLCEVNQLPPEEICVNGRPLCQEELVLLQGCSNPPKKLKPGKYWYDKVSGLWGKEGQKPCSIISPHLNVGGPITSNVSNGKTQVFINDREITKTELRMLRLAGVQCAGNPHFWLYADGTYLEEGQQKIRGQIWGKAATKLICAVLSLPVPSKAINASGEVNNMVSTFVPSYLGQRTLHKLLLLGCNGSGTSTIFKQARKLYQAVPFSEEERQNIKLMIQSKVYSYLAILLEGRERFEEESLTEMRKKQSSDQSIFIGDGDDSSNRTIYSIGPRLKAFSDWLLKVMVSGNLEVIFPAATREYAPLVEELWKDSSIQATYNRRSELEMLPTDASYFLERVVDISRTDYEPSDMDILYAEGIISSNGLACMDFTFPCSEYNGSDAADQHDSLIRYQLIRVHARGLGENCKWLEMFEDVRIVIFCVSLSDYDQFCDDGNGVAMNKMLMSKKLFESIVSHPTFVNMAFLLILNKFDMLEAKVERVSLHQCDWFNDFNPVISRHRAIHASSINNSPSLAQMAFHYIAVKFKRLFYSLTRRKLYVNLANGLESDTVDEALRYAREILKWEEGSANFNNSEESIYSNEASSLSN